MKKQIIDFVITWVDGSDPLWFRQKQNAKKKQGVSVDIDDRIERYRDWEILKYLFRSIENFAPWVNNVYFVTCGHLPAWLNTECPKLQIVSHKDFIPEKYLPTFNSHSIEWNFHRIKNLSEHFVYFNDDMFLLHPIKPTDFFENGKPVDMLALQPDVANVEDTIFFLTSEKNKDTNSSIIALPNCIVNFILLFIDICNKVLFLCTFFFHFVIY